MSTNTSTPMTWREQCEARRAKIQAEQAERERLNAEQMALLTPEKVAPFAKRFQDLYHSGASPKELLGLAAEAEAAIFTNLSHCSIDEFGALANALKEGCEQFSRPDWREAHIGLSLGDLIKDRQSFASRYAFACGNNS